MESHNSTIIGRSIAASDDLNAPSALHPHRPDASVVWTLGMLFVTLISLCAVVGIAVMRVLPKKVFDRFITFFVSLGVGSLSGSAVFHLLPQAFGLVHEFDANANHEYMRKSWTAIIGIYLFFFCDRIIRIILETKKRRSNQTTALTEPPTATFYHCQEESTEAEEGRRSSSLLLSKSSDSSTCNEKGLAMHNSQEGSECERGSKLEAQTVCVHDHDLKWKEGDSVIATVAWMIVFGDGLHNLIDGISIGASFSESVLSGISVSVAVVCEEFPHELGDVAILVSAGMTLRQALVYNLLSALTCYVGFFIGVLVGNVDDAFASYTFGFAGGMFLYIALACMMPDMKNAMEIALNVSIKRGLGVLVLQASGLFCGLTLMASMARYGGEISFS